ncbi:hypothetical protein MtrunA17_Chr8g0388171 [Medicago truncatula]|uniref:Uncharacterized protein n=1 Tax=Medicago truncatula TaxID=3880 RepID=A0A396GXV2_MEDTR|nr:hypothetical protein MtrunA17_Chr8g0388171 [Medicago truncatula]
MLLMHLNLKRMINCHRFSKTKLEPRSTRWFLVSIGELDARDSLQSVSCTTHRSNKANKTNLRFQNSTTQLNSLKCLTQPLTSVEL